MLCQIVFPVYIIINHDEKFPKYVPRFEQPSHLSILKYVPEAVLRSASFMNIHEIWLELRVL
jgi:hypothetical protein